MTLSWETFGTTSRCIHKETGEVIGRVQQTANMPFPEYAASYKGRHVGYYVTPEDAMHAVMHAAGVNATAPQ